MIFSFSPIKKLSSLISRNFLVLAMLVFALVSKSWGETYYWVGGLSGEWDAAANWNTALDGSGTSSVPGNADTAVFTNTSDTVSVANTSGNPISVGSITLLNGYGGSDASLVSIDLNGASLSVGTLNVGDDTDGQMSAGNLKLSNASVTVETLDGYTMADCKLTLENTSLSVTGTFWADITDPSIRFRIDGDSSSTLVVSGTVRVAANGLSGVRADSFSGDLTVTVSDANYDTVFGFTWTGGASSSDWNDSGNWNSGAVPDSQAIVRIPPLLAYYPELTSASSMTVPVESISITGGTLTVDGGALLGKKIIVSQGSLSVTSGSVSCENLTLSGSGSLTQQNGSINLSADLAVSGSGDFTQNGGTVNIDGNISLSSSGSYTQTSGNVNLDGNLSFSGSGKYNQSGGSVTLLGNVLSSSAGGVDSSGGKFVFAGSSVSVSGRNTFYEVDFASDCVLSLTDSNEISRLTVNHDVSVILASSLSSPVISGSGSLAFSGSGPLTIGAVGSSASRFGNFTSNITGTTTCTGNLYASSLIFSGNVSFGNAVTVVDSSSSINFGGTVSGRSLSFKAASGITLGGNVTSTGNLVFDSGSSPVAANCAEIRSTGGNVTFKNELSCTSAFTVKAVNTIEFNGLSSTAGTFTAGANRISLNAGDYISSGNQTFNGDVTLLAGSAAGNFSWRGGTGTLISVSGNLNLSHSNVAYSLGSNLTVGGNFYFTAGDLSVSGVRITCEKTFAVWGSSYNATDPRYSNSNTRFALAGSDSVSVTSPSANFTTLSSAQFNCGGKFYVNGADLNAESLTVTLPANADSAILFNPSDSPSSGAIGGSGVYTQWGSDADYAAVFNCSVSNVTVACSSSSGGSAYIAAASGSQNQNVTDGGGNTSVTFDASGNPSSATGFQFAIPEIVEAYSVFDDVIYVKFNMMIENSNGEISRTLQNNASLLSGGFWYGSKSHSFGGAWANADCTLPLSASGVSEIYVKIHDSDYSWNTDATAVDEGSADSSDRRGNHRSIKTDLSMMVGVFSAEYGHTMGKNYGTLSEGVFDSTYDKCPPVLAQIFVGQELHSQNTGTASSQKYYDAHNFIEFKYSEPVNIASFLYDSDAQNVQATSSLGEITNLSSGFRVAGLATFANGSVNASSRSTGSPHALYRKFSLSSSASESTHPCRIRLSVAGFVDGTVSYGSSSFYNWVGYINSSSVPAGRFSGVANDLITDLAVDLGGNPLNNKLDAANSGNHALSRTVDTTASDIYGRWDTSNPVFAVYVTDLSSSDTGWDWKSFVSSDERQYEVIGSATSNTGTYIDNIEVHLFDNTPSYSSTDSYKWVSMNGWTYSSSLLAGFETPESSGGGRAFSSGGDRTSGGIRRSSLVDANSAFSYSYSLDSSASSFRSFSATEISQDVKSALFQRSTVTHVNTQNDGLYLSLALNASDAGTLPLRTTFTVIYEPSKAFITDLAGNRIVEVDSSSSVKKICSIDMTPPSFSMSLAPVGDNKLYMIFTKPLGHGGSLLNSLSDSALSSALNSIKENLEFVLSDSDDRDTSDVCTDLSVESVSLATHNTDKYTALLLNLNRTLTLEDIEKTWIRVSNTNGLENVTTIFGTDSASPIQDRFRNSISLHSCHAISDFALNTVNVLYAYAKSTGDDDWNEQFIYGAKSLSDTDGYAVRNFHADAGKSGHLKTGNDIVFQVQFVGGVNSDGYFAPQNGEKFVVLPDCKDNLQSSWISDKFNKYTGCSWRIWLTSYLESLASSYNTNSLNVISDIEDVKDSVLLKNFTLENSVFNFGNKKEYQFIFGLKASSTSTGLVTDSSGSITINHDADSSTPRVPLYALWMPSSNMAKGDYSFIDLWSFVTRDIVQQRGGVTILNNVIDSKQKEQCVVEVVMPKDSNLNVYVMTLDGNIVKKLSKGRVSKGTHYYQWNGTNSKGKSVARGMYFVRVVGPDIDETRKVMVVKN